jgi:hypothetical protein
MYHIATLVDFVECDIILDIYLTFCWQLQKGRHVWRGVPGNKGRGGGEEIGEGERWRFFSS